jgi:hypothetical protein
VYWGALRQRSGAGEGVVEEEDVVEAVESPAHGSERPRVGSKRKRPASKKIASFCSTGASVATSPTLTTELQPETRSPASMDTDALVVFDEMPPSKSDFCPHSFDRNCRSLDRIFGTSMQP